MSRIVEITASVVRATRQTYAKKWSFFGAFVLVFITSVGVLGRLDLLPETAPAGPEVARESLVATSTLPLLEAETPEEPVEVSIPSLGLRATVENPTTTNVVALDKLLLKGAVRYPTSAKLGEDGNVVLFGHSSYLPVVGNKAYKTFNEIQKLKSGDRIVVSSEGIAYTYAVRTVANESAEDGAIPLSVSGRVLTLATCDSFGKKTDRFVVTADFVESRPVGA